MESGTEVAERLQDISDAWNGIPGGDYDPFKDSDVVVVNSNDVILASNTISPEVYVDYGTTYYSEL